jgi:hypothetical protein
MNPDQSYSSNLVEVSAPQATFVLRLDSPWYQYLGLLRFLLESHLTGPSSLLQDPWQAVSGLAGAAMTTAVLSALYHP